MPSFKTHCAISKKKTTAGKSKVNKIKTVAIVSLALCVILSTILVSAVRNWQALEQQKDEENRKLHFQLINETRIAYEYWENWTRWKKAEVNETEISPEDQRYFLDQHSELYESILNGYNPHTLKTVIMHECIKTSENISLPDVAYTYQKLRDGFAPYEVLILPEYNGNLNWRETLQWISTDFAGVPICLSVFEGGGENLPNPNVKLTITEIEKAMNVSDVRMVKFTEMISWYMNASRTQSNVTYPVDEARSILEFCRSKNLKVLWSEWKISYDVLPLLNSTLSGFEDIVTLVYQTNNEFDEVFVGYLYATQFKHWGASVQSWYWEEQGFGLEGDMPVDLMVEHAVLARNMGAEIVQFEPYWYFFDNGEPLETMRTMWSII
jgi:hypothetical protein